MEAYALHPHDMYYTSYLHKSFPEHHYAFENTRHKIGDYLRSFHVAKPWQIPNADVRETKNKFFIDLELPGIETTEKLKLKWTNSRTLLLEATAHRPSLPADELPASQEGTTKDVKTTEATDTTVEPDESHGCHLILSERWFGSLTRAFHFPVDIDQDALKATLKAGLLHLIVPKLEIQQPKEGKIEVVQ